MDLILYAKEMANKHYDEKGLAHAYRVAKYVEENELIPEEIKERCIALGYMHDLVEDTDYKPDEKMLDKQFIECLGFLTKEKGRPYLDYIKDISSHKASHPETFWTKCADMKDHLMLKDTLTERLRDKYMKAMPYLL